MSKLQFTELAWAEYLYWLGLDRKTTKKINQLLSDIMRNGELTGIGKPERLKGDMSEYCSRHINEKDRLVYRTLDDGIIEIYSCKGHYED